MKKILFSLLAVGGLSLTNAQVQVYTENFNTESAPGWVFKDLDGDGKKWGDIWKVTNQAGVAVTPISLISRSWQTVPLTPDNTATSPLIDLTNAKGKITLSWKVLAAAAEWDQEHYAVYVHTASDINAAIKETPAFEETYNDPNNKGTIYTRTVDISAFSGQKVYLTMRHFKSTDMDFIAIDDITIEAESVLGSSDLNASKNLQIYPNPVGESFKINLPATLGTDIKVTVKDLTGRSVANFSKSDSYNVSSLPKGVYIVTISDGNYTTSQKIVKK